MSDDGHISQEDLALHAMQALSPEEAESVRRHVAGCERCSEELAALNGDLALVAMSVEQKAVPAGARQRFMAQIGATSAAPQAAQPAVAPVTRVQAKRRLAWVPSVAVAALLVLAAWLGARVSQLSERLERESEIAGRLARTNAQLEQENAHAREVLELLTAQNAQRAVLTAEKMKPVPMGHAVYLAESGSLMFQGSNLGPLPEGKTYEIWVIPMHGGAPMPAGMFRPDAKGDASVMTPMLPKGIPAKAFGITIENAGGSETPTMPIVLLGAASNAGE